MKVLFYHRVNNYGDYFGMDPRNFELQIKYLSKKFRIINLREFLERISRKERSRNSLLISFDDGYRDNYEIAYPILKKYSVPAAIFLTTDFVDGKMWIWHDKYRHIIGSTAFRKVDIFWGGQEHQWNLTEHHDIQSARKVIHRYCRRLPPKAREAELMKLAELLKVNLEKEPPKKYSPLLWSQIAEMSGNGIEFGAHTCTHEILSRLEYQEAYREILLSKNRIEEQLRVPVTAFAYPNGRPGDFTEETKTIVRECGYSAAFTTIRGINTPFTNPLELRRIFPSPHFGYHFWTEVSGFNILLQKLKDSFLQKFRNRLRTRPS